MRLAIGICCNRDAKPKFLVSLLHLVSRLHTMESLEAMDLLLKENVSNLSNGREAVLREALAAGASHLLWLDDDMVFPDDLAHRLLRANKDVIGCNYVTKDPAGPKPTVLGVDGAYLNSANRSGVEQVGRIGLGAVLVRLRALRDIPAPAFPVQWSPHHEAYRGEDYAFCDLLAERGISIHCDHDLSKEIGHVGTFVYGFGNCVEKDDRDRDRAAPGTGGQSPVDVPQGGRRDPGVVAASDAA